jgi:putative CocE/NonD family hydrolase
MSKTVPTPFLTSTADQLPTTYDRPPTHERMIEERDTWVPMRDGVRLCIDVYRPDTSEKVPALLAFAVYNKDMQAPEVMQAVTPQPAYAPLWTGWLEAGDSRFFTARGYAHVIGAPRGIGKSEGGGSREFDSYDLIEWIAAQPWCDGNVGMVGISGYGAEQFYAAKQQPPHLKAIFPFDPRGAYGPLGSFREEYPGGVVHLFRYHLVGSGAVPQHRTQGPPGTLPPEREALWREAMDNPDYRMFPHVHNIITQKGQSLPLTFDLLIDPYDKEAVVRRAEDDFAKVKIPAYTGSGWYGYTYKQHLSGALNWFGNLGVPKKLALLGPGHLERPFHTLHQEILRWHDHWLKGIDTGIMDEPPVKYWVMGENAWRCGDDWPLPETQWTKLYLTSWGRLRPEPFLPASNDGAREPDAFVQMPLKQTTEVQKLRYLSEPLPRDTLVAGPMVLNLFASIDQDDTNWIVVVSDVGPDVSVRTAREGERDVPKDLPEREVTRGWLKASNRALDPARSKPWKPWHRLTREARQKVTPGEIVEYAIEVLSSANLFKAGHRICVDICAMDVPTGVGGATNVEYISYHVGSSKTVLHKVYHDEQRPSHILLPVIPQE